MMIHIFKNVYKNFFSEHYTNKYIDIHLHLYLNGAVTLGIAKKWAKLQNITLPGEMMKN